MSATSPSLTKIVAKADTPQARRVTVNGTEQLMRPDAPDDGRYVSKEVYWTKFYEHRNPSYEWNNGILEAKPLPNKVEFKLYHWFLLLLERFLASNPLADLMGLETGFHMIVPDPENPNEMKETVRKPDIAVIRHDNVVVWDDDERSYKGVCDLCVGSLSDSTKDDVERDAVTKKFEYEFAGVQEYYILDPNKEHMHFYRRNQHNSYDEILPDANGVIRSAVLPGFQFRLKDLIERPDLEILALEEIYRGYLLPKYQAAEARAEEEHRRAEEERQRSARYAAKLRELGVEVDDDLSP